MLTEVVDTVNLQEDEAIINGPHAVFRLPVRGNPREISSALIFLNGINRRTRNRESQATYHCVSGQIAFLVWHNGEHTLQQLSPGDRIKIVPGDVYQDFGRGLLVSVDTPAFDPTKTEVLDQLMQLPDFAPGKMIRETAHYQVVTDWKPSLENSPTGQRFYIVPRNLAAEAILVQAASLHRVPTLTPRRISEIGGTLNALRADFIPENIPALLYGLTEVPPDGRDSIPSPDRLEECLKKHPDRYTFFD
ncbi:hypothetical protein HY310_00315 [Candidatus Microgenomates bacterium]|nr:hypothetical protein [Candidatus Microgenomates bacterium]